MRLMLAATCNDPATLRYPIMVSPKLDGVRAMVQDGVVWSRSWKPIPNRQVQLVYGKLEGYDGELIVGPANTQTCYRYTMSGVMTENKELKSLTFRVFDDLGSREKPFVDRLASIHPTFRLAHSRIDNVNQLLALEEHYLAMGFEGVIGRDPTQPYKHGRSTLREQGMVKLKRFKDDEAKVIGFEELLSNQNEAAVNAQGYTERSSHQENKVPMNTLGALVVAWQGLTFKIGTGFMAYERKQIWETRNVHLGRLVKFKYLAVGMKDLPRHPVFLGFRDLLDNDGDGNNPNATLDL